MKGEALPNEVLNTLFVKRNGIVGNELLLLYNFGAKMSRPQLAPISIVSRAEAGLSTHQFILNLFYMAIDNRTSEKITFEKVGNLICLDSCLTSTSSRCSPEI